MATTTPTPTAAAAAPPESAKALEDLRKENEELVKEREELKKTLEILSKRKKKEKDSDKTADATILQLKTEIAQLKEERAAHLASIEDSKKQAVSCKKQSNTHKILLLSTKRRRQRLRFVLNFVL